MIRGRRWQDLRRDRRTPLERAFSPVVRIVAVILAVTVATAAAVHALHVAEVPRWLQPVGSEWV
jgi:hypothetical protein